jgi:hypothetical protein
MEQDQSALIPSNKGELPRELKKSTDSDFDRIYKFYHHSKTQVKLTAEEEAIRERWEKAWFLLCKGRTNKHVVDLMVKLFNISTASAYNDVRKAQMLFGDPKNDLIEGRRRIHEQQLQDGAQRAWAKGDLEMHLKYLKEISEIRGFKEPLPETDLAGLMKKLVPTQINIITSAEDLQKLAEKMRAEITRDVDYQLLDSTNGKAEG